MRGWRHRKAVRGEFDARDANVADAAPNEFDAFLSGQYVAYLLRHSRAVPSWAWINQLAHATSEELEAITTDVAYLPPAPPWQQVVGDIARTLSATVDGNDGRLHELQQKVLVPVELALAREWDRPLSPNTIRDLVLWALVSKSDE